METTPSFDLNRAVQDWRENIAQSPALRSENLYELESHLRDSFTTLQNQGLSPEESFIIATRRIGKVDALEMEFAKVNRHTVWLERALWMLIGVQMWGMVSGLTGAVARNAMAWGWANLNSNYKGSGLGLPVALFSLVQVLVIVASLGLCGWLVVRKGEKLSALLSPLLLRRSTLGVTCTAFCLFSLIPYALNGLLALLANSVGVASYASTAMCLNYSGLIAWPIQVVALIILTLALARKHLRERQGFGRGESTPF